MNTIIRSLALLALALTFLAITACGEGSNPESHSAEDGHDHTEQSSTEQGHEGHDHAPGEHGHHEDHGESRALGAIEVAGITLDVSISGEIKPGATVHVDLARTSGPAPAAVRLWIGDESGTGALKAKAGGDGEHFHADAEGPASLDGASLWIEVETDDGDRASASVPLQA